MASSRIRQDGYFDSMYSVFEAHHHPIVVVEDGAMRWMGLRVCPEAYGATVSLLPFSLRAEFLVIGGASLVILGSKRKTEDVDFAITSASLHAFEEAARNDPRFSKGTVAE